MQLSLGSHYMQFMSEAVLSGRYSSENDVIRKAILLLEMEERKIAMVQNELIAGENSPMITDLIQHRFWKKIVPNAYE